MTLPDPVCPFQLESSSTLCFKHKSYLVALWPAAAMLLSLKFQSNFKNKDWKFKCFKRTLSFFLATNQCMLKSQLGFPGGSDGKAYYHNSYLFLNDFCLMTSIHVAIKYIEFLAILLHQDLLLELSRLDWFILFRKKKITKGMEFN